ncbi:MAG: endonuclease/exonuclease/phosphatase family protein [Candidatus Acidiferrum sp.]
MMRLLTYNIHKGIGGSDRRYRIERIVDVIAAAQADVICLQEVDQNVRRSHFHDQPALLAERLGAAAHLYQLNVPHADGGYGNLVLARWPFRRHAHVPLRLGKRKPRGAQLVIVDSPMGPLRIVNWHLGLSERERRWQARHLLRHPKFSEHDHLPTLIAGDFNDWRNSLKRHGFAGSHFVQATAPSRRFRSFPAFLAVASLDKVYYRGDLRIDHVRVVRNRLTRRASDHLPLIVDFEMERNGH